MLLDTYEFLKELNEMEFHYIKQYNSHISNKNGYNVTYGFEGLHGKWNNKNNYTWEDLYGKEKADVLKKARRKMFLDENKNPNKLIKGKKFEDVYSKNTIKKRKEKTSKNSKMLWNNNKEKMLKNNNFIKNNPMNYINFDGKNNPNFGKKHPNLNSKVWLILNSDNSEYIIKNLTKFCNKIKNKIGTFRRDTLIKYGKENKFYKGYWCKQINNDLNCLYF